MKMVRSLFYCLLMTALFYSCTSSGQRQAPLPVKKRRALNYLSDQATEITDENIRGRKKRLVKEARKRQKTQKENNAGNNPGKDRSHSGDFPFY